MPGTRSRKSVDLKEVSDSDDDSGTDREKGNIADTVDAKDKDDKDEDAGEEDEEEEEFTVEAILNKRTISGVTKYLIKWEGFDETYNTWEPEDNLDCEEILEEFERNWKEKRGKAKTGKAKPGAFSGASNPTPSTSSSSAAPLSYEPSEGDDLDHFDEQGKKAASLQLKTNPRRMDIRPQVHVEGKLKLYGLDRGLEPRYILGTVVNTKGKKFFLVIWRDSEEGDMVPIEDFSEKYPQFVLSYFESHRVWLPSIDHFKEDESTGSSDTLELS